MLSDNIKNYRKNCNMSQDELADKLGVSRQSISLWETGQTQPTIENIIALSKIFGVSSDALLGVEGGASPVPTPTPAPKKKKKGLIALIVAIIVLVVAIVGYAVYALINGAVGFGSRHDDTHNVDTTETTVADTETDTDVETTETETTEAQTTTEVATTEAQTTTEAVTTKAPETTAAPKKVDLFEYCKEFAIKIGRLNGDYTIYQQPSNLYGGYDGEYFSLSYWADSDMVEFCLHSPTNDTTSINFYLRMRGGYNGKYEYLVSRYYRDDGSEIRGARGYIDPKTFSDSRPIPCDSYNGDFENQDVFMENAREGMCDLIKCLKQFVKVEKMDITFADFGFKNF